MNTPTPDHRADGSLRPTASLCARDLSFAYDGRMVLHKVSLDLVPGRLIGVIGPNGAGKSTLVRLLSGLLAPATGDVLLDGRPIARWPQRELARRLAVVPQSPNLPEAFTAAEVVLLGRTPYLGLLGNESAHDWQVARQAMERTQTLHIAQRLIGTLSGGERQRVVVARALAQQAPILLLDEPTTHLDVNHQLGLIVLMRHLVAQDGLAVLIILHDLNLASVYCDELILLAGGEIIAHGSPQQVLTQARISNAYQADVLVMNHPQTGRPIIVPQVWGEA